MKPVLTSLFVSFLFSFVYVAFFRVSAFGVCCYIFQMINQIANVKLCQLMGDLLITSLCGKSC